MNEKNVKKIIFDSIKTKLRNYNPERHYMPFHLRLIGKDRMALFSFIQSLNTSFGTSIFEPVAVEIAKSEFKFAERQVTSGTHLTDESFSLINNLVNNLISAKSTPNKQAEIESIKKVLKKGKQIEIKPTKVDLKLVSKDDVIYLIDLKTAKPNVGEFKGYKRTLLEWIAVTLSDGPTAKVESLICIPYNPYEPEPYDRWTIRGMLDLERELKVADEFWDFLGGEGTYQKLLNIFEQVGIELREEIDEYFKKYN